MIEPPPERRAREREGEKEKEKEKVSAMTRSTTDEPQQISCANWCFSQPSKQNRTRCKSISRSQLTLSPLCHTMDCSEQISWRRPRQQLIGGQRMSANFRSQIQVGRESLGVSNEGSEMKNKNKHAKRVKPTRRKMRQIREHDGQMVVRLTLLTLTTLLLIFLQTYKPQTDSDSNWPKAGSSMLILTAQAQLLNSLYLSSSSAVISANLAHGISGNSNGAILKRDLSVRQAPHELPSAQTAQSAKYLRTNNVCQVSNGESVAIVEIEESRGTDMSQSTSPLELPISGSVGLGEVELKIESETHKYFQIQDKRLRLTRPLDRDAILKENSTQFQQQPISSIYLQVSCIDKRPLVESATGDQILQQARKVIIPVLVKVLDLNDNAPKFTSPIYTVQVDELTPINTVIADQIQAIDLDSANNGLVEYSLLGSLSQHQHQHQQQQQRQQQQTRPSQTSQTYPPARLVQRAPSSDATERQQQQTQTQSIPTTTSGLSNILGGSYTADSLVTISTLTNTTPGSPRAIESSSTTAVATDEVGDSASSSASGSSGSSSVIYPMSSSPATTVLKNGPTINLDSDPIENGPMEEGEEEAQSDEALLASMNSTDTDTTDSDTMTLMLSGKGLGASRRRRARRQAIGVTTRMANKQDSPTTTTTAAASMMTTLPATNRMPETTRSKLGLWTNLLAPGDDTMSVIGDRMSQNVDSLEFFSLDFIPGTNRPIIRLKKQLDYESKRIHTLTIIATDKATNKQERLSSSASIVIKVLDGDDQGPAFVLDQSGCATGPVPPTTTTISSLVMVAPERSLIKRRDLSSVTDLHLQGSSSGEEQAGANLRHQAQQVNLPKGFKVTEENFEFGDMSTGDEGDIYDQSLEVSPMSRADSRLPHDGSSSSSATQAGRARRYQTQSEAKSSSQSGSDTGVNGIQAVAAQNNDPANVSRVVSKSHYTLDYSCLPVWPELSGGQAEYFATVMSGDSDYLLRVAPQLIKARDRDELNAPIRYSFLNGTPTNYSQYFHINPLDASIKQIAPIVKSQPSKFVIWVQAQEQTANKLSSLARLTIDVVPTDKNPPVLVPNSYAGFIEENSPIGSGVWIINGPTAAHIDSSGRQISGQNFTSRMRINVLDADHAIAGSSSATSGQPEVDIDSKPMVKSHHSQMYEFETTSDAFKVNNEGFVYVNQALLDRDPPSQAVHSFQVTAHQIGLASSRSISSPVSINVTLLDLNDNPPIIANASLVPIQLAANNRGVRAFTTIRVLDNDLPENARAHFSIKHVSNNGRARFRINEETGELEALGKFSAGEQFSLTIQVADELGRASQGILEVQVIPGPNTSGPQFVVDSERDNSRGYSVELNEGIAPHSAVIQVQAVDPENDPIAYSIIDGNVNNDFYINSKSGQIYVNNKLDREEVSAYNLMVQARDSGGLATSRPVRITILDNNDQNPIFSEPQYVFSIEEGVSNYLIGRVLATDGDAAENGQISYFLDHTMFASASLPTVSLASGRPLFSIDEQTGEIRVLEPLDYEQAKSHTLLVTAKDHGENPRSTTASVLIRVQDVQDEQPYFERYYIETKLQENLGQHKLTQVQARDPDSVARITYVLKSGNSELFAVDPQTGTVTTNRGLDFEESKTHTLLIGTIENQEEDLLEIANKLSESLSNSALPLERSPICRVDVTVLDVNDNAPHFVQQPLPVRIQDSAQLGTVVTRVTAEDGDASEPNNQIRYELVTRTSALELNPLPESNTITSDRCAQSFMVDATSGTITVKSDLKRDSQSECQLFICAKDLGQPNKWSLSSSITIFIDHIAEISPATMIGFADTSFTVELEENCASGTLVKVLHIVNKPKINFPMSCEIVSGNEMGKFYVSENEQRDCEIRTRDSVLDFELRQKYSLTLRLNTIGGSSKTIAQVNINILDRNDNKPTFQLQARYSHLTHNKFLAAIAIDAPSDTQVIQMRASDLDSPHSNGLISYELLNDKDLGGRFKVDPIDGIVRTSRSVEDVPSGRLPLRLKIMARDNPEIPSNSLEAIAEVVVNLIEDKHRMALVLKDTPTGRALDSKEEILSVLQERSGLISGLEKAESLKVQRNGSLEPDVSGTDFWFYLIEPGTFRIVTNDDPRVRSSLFDQRAHNSLLDIVRQTLGFNVARLRLPYSISASYTGRSSLSFSTSRSLTTAANSLASALILIGLFIAIISAIVVVFQCGTWSSYSRTKTKDKLHLSPAQSYYQCPSIGCPKSPPGLTSSSQDVFAFRSAFSTLQQQQQQPPLPQSLMPQLLNQRSNQQMSSLYQIEPPAAAEYETQMLKMSVLFDDSNSLNEQHLNENSVNLKNLN